MATKKSKTKAPDTPTGNGLSEAQSALCSVMQAARPEGITVGEAQASLASMGGTATVELTTLVDRNFIIQTGQGMFRLTKDAEGNPCFLSGNPPTETTPDAPQPQSKRQAAQESLPWMPDLPAQLEAIATGDANMSVELHAKLDTIIDLLTQLAEAADSPRSLHTPAPPAQQAAPTAPTPVYGEAPPLPPGYQQMQANEPTPPPYTPPQQYQQPQAPQYPPQSPYPVQQAPQQPPWQQPQYQQPQAPQPPQYQPPQQQQVPNGYSGQQNPYPQGAPAPWTPQR